MRTRIGQQASFEIGHRLEIPDDDLENWRKVLEGFDEDFIEAFLENLNENYADKKAAQSLGEILSRQGVIDSAVKSQQKFRELIEAKKLDLGRDLTSAERFQLLKDIMSGII